MTVPSLCKVCDHRDLERIDADVRAGVSNRMVVERYGGFSTGSIARHRRNGHVAPDPSGRRPGVPVTDPHEVLRRVMDDLAAMDTSKMAPAAKIAHLDAMRRVSADLAKLAPPPPPTAVTMEEVEGLPEFLTMLADLLEPYPTVRRELDERVEAAGLSGVFG